MNKLKKFARWVAVAIIGVAVGLGVGEVYHNRPIHVMETQVSVANGTTWSGWTMTEKKIYLSGLSRGEIALAVTVKYMAPPGGDRAVIASAVNRAIDTDLRLWAVSPDKLIADLDGFYEDPTHRPVSVMDAVATLEGR